MAQEIINLKHHAISGKPTGKNSSAWISVHARPDRGAAAYIYFSSGAVEKFGLEAGKTVTIINDLEGCYFYCSDNPDGFVLRTQQKNRGGLFLQNYSLIKYLMSKYPSTKFSERYYLNALGSEIQGHSLIEINLSESVQDIFKHNFQKITKRRGVLSNLKKKHEKRADI